MICLDRIVFKVLRLKNFCKKDWAVHHSVELALSMTTYVRPTMMDAGFERELTER